MGMPFIWLGRYLLPDDFREARQWVANLAINDLLTATYQDWNTGEWVESSVHSHLRISDLDFSNPQIKDVFQSYLYSGLIACLGINRLLDDYKPEVLFLFNGRQSSTRVALEIARKRGIRVICHERGSLKESLKLTENIPCISLHAIKQVWQYWKDIPLIPDELEEISQYMHGRQFGMNLNWRSYSPEPQDVTSIRRNLGLNPDRLLFVLFNSSDDELIAHKEWQGPFSKQTDWIKKTVNFAERHPEVDLVIRVHPNIAGKKATGNNFQQLQDFENLRNRLPRNARLVMPEEPISSYSLMDLANLGLVYMSTAGLEMACKGKNVIVAGGGWLHDKPFVKTVQSAEAYEKMLEVFMQPSVQDNQDNCLDIMRMAYRYAYSVFFRLSIPFPLVKMPDPHTGRLAYNSLDALLPGREPNLDRIAGIILENEPVCPPPSANDRLRSESCEFDWFQKKIIGNPAPQDLATGTETKAPLVSVIIPAYNKANYIQETIDSVLEQKFDHIEIIVVDDGSTDNTANIVKKYNRRVRFFYKQNDGYQGPGGAINLGLNEAKGKFIHCLDSDDLLMPGYYQRVLGEFEKNEQLGAVATDAYQINDQGIVERIFKLGHFKNMEEFHLEALHHNPIIASSIIVKRECYERVGGRRPEYEIADDYELWLRISEYYDILLIPEPLIRYRYHESGISRNIEKTRKLDKKIITEYFRRHDLGYFFPELASEDTIENRVRAHLKLADIFLNKRLYEETIAESQKALSFNTDLPACYNILGVSYLQLGQLNKAKEYFLKVIELDQANSLARDNLRKLGCTLELKKILIEKARQSISPAAKLKVLMVAHGFPPHSMAGTELYTYALAQEFHRRGYSVRVLYPEYDTTRPEGTVTEDSYEGLAVTRINRHPDGDIVLQFQNEPLAASFGTYLKRLPVDLVHFHHLIHLSASVLRACSQQGIPTVMTVHDGWFLCEQTHFLGPEGGFCEKGPETVDKCVHCFVSRHPKLKGSEILPQLFYVLAKRRQSLQGGLTFVDTLVVPTRFIEKTLKAHGFEHPRVVFAPLGLLPFRTLPWQPRDGSFRFTYLGQMTFIKGVDVLIRAFNRVGTGNARLDLYGSVPDPAYFRRAMAEIKPARPTEYHGPYLPTNLSLILARTDVAVCSSRSENYPAVIRECLHAGVPVIGPNIGGVPEIIQDGENGLLFRPGDDRDLAEKLRFFIEDPGRVAAFRQRIQPVRTIEEDASQLETIYQETVRQRFKWVQTGVVKASEKDTDHPTWKAEVSIIIPVFNKLPLTRLCLESIRANTAGVAYEIIVVDNGSTDGTVDFLRQEEEAGRLKVIPNSENLGFAKACNQGAREASGRYLLFLNNDTQVKSEWVPPLLHILDSDSAVAASGSKLLFPDGALQHAGIAIIEDRKLPDPLVARHLYYRQASDLPEANVTRQYQALTAACLLIRKDAFDEVKGFDEGYWNGYEDVDLCFKLRERGWKLIYQPESVVIHFESQSGNERFAKVSKNISRLHEKWLGKVKPDLIIEKDGTAKETRAAGILPYSMVKRPEVILQSSHQQEKRISIVILTFNQLEYTKKCVESIRKHTPVPHEIIFVDNASKDGTIKWLKKLTQENPNFKLIENKKNLGFSKGCNQGITASSGEYILLLNNDILVTEGWLSGMLECINSSPDIGVVGPMTNNISGLQKVVNADYSDIDHLEGYAKAFREKNRYRRIPSRRIVGFCMLFRRELVEKIGLLDETFGSGNYEDDDFCLRASLEGYRNLIAGDVFIHHYGSRSFIGNKIDYSSSMAANRKKFSEKWNGLDAQSPLGKKALSFKAMEKADVLNQKGQNDEAVNILIGGIRLFPNDRNLHSALSEMLIDFKKYQDALDILNEMPSDNNDIRKLALIGYCKEGGELYEEAKQYADRALLFNPTYPLAVNLMGMLAYKKGDKNAAEGFFKKAIEADPGYGEPYTNLGVLKWVSEQKEQGLDFLEKGFILSPTMTDIVTAYYSAITAMEEFSRAEPVFREAKGLYPMNRRIAFLLIDLLIRQGKNRAAMEDIEDAMIAFGVDDGILRAAIEIRNRIGTKEIDKQIKGKSSLSLCMIVKNEEQGLSRCLRSVEPVVDEMIVVDTGSTDRTKEIAEAFGAEVFEFEWPDSFAEARNYSISKASGQWILVMDADEMISPKDYDNLARLVKNGKPATSAYSFITRNYVNRSNVEGWKENDGAYSVEEAGIGWFPSQKVRLFPNDSQIRFENPVHEFVEPSLIRSGINISFSNAVIHHYGKLDEEKSFSKGETYYNLGKRKLDEMGGNVDALRELAIQAAELKKYDEAVELWKKLILLQPGTASAFLNLGHAYLQLGEYEEALLASKKAMELDPKMKEAFHNYATCELCSGHVQTVITVLEGLLKRVPGYPSAIGLLGVAYIIVGRTKLGLEYIEKLWRNKNDVAEYLFNHTARLLKARRKEYAISLLEAAVESKNINEAILTLHEECKKIAEFRNECGQKEKLSLPAQV
jgi:GT2 family glycosyltransferase/glycosyltransferase involved in cell wall biosynthesis